MPRTVTLFIVVVLVLVGGTLVALAWWSLADKFFPGAARSTGQGVSRAQRRQAERDRAVVVKGFDEPEGERTGPVD
jgi:hypothetical protein